LEEVLSRDGRIMQAFLVLQIEAFRQFAAVHSPKPHEPLPLSSDATWDATALGSWQASAYGTTLLGVLVGPEVVFLFQQGDGAMVEIRGAEARYVVPPPSAAIANVTPSMCNDDAVHETVATTRPVAATDSLTGLLVTTDGIPNSYAKHTGFLAFCSDVVASGLSKPGLEERLRQWLPQISAKGSQDDMSIALLLDSAADRRPDDARSTGEHEGDALGASARSEPLLAAAASETTASAPAEATVSEETPASSDKVRHRSAVHGWRLRRG